MLFFKRLTATMVEKYDFVNGAPAIGATVDLKEVLDTFREHYGSKPPHRNLYAYFTQVKMPNIQFPSRRFFTTNDPVLTPELLDHFFNVQTKTFENLNERQKALLHSIYDLPAYWKILPALPDSAEVIPIRRHQRFSVRCPARIVVATSNERQEIVMEVIEVSRYGLQARARDPLPLNTWCDLTVQVGRSDVAHFRALALRENENGFNGFYGFRLGEPDVVWQKFVSALYRSTTYNDLDAATRFLN